MPEIKKNAVVNFDIVNILNDYHYKTLIDEFIETKKETVFEEIIKKLNKKEKDSVQNNLGIIFFNCNINYFVLYLNPFHLQIKI